MCHYHQAPHPHHPLPGGKANSDSCQILHRWRGERLCRHCQVPEETDWWLLILEMGEIGVCQITPIIIIVGWVSGSSDTDTGARSSDLWISFPFFCSFFLFFFLLFFSFFWESGSADTARCQIIWSLEWCLELRYSSKWEKAKNASRKHLIFRHLGLSCQNLLGVLGGKIKHYVSPINWFFAKPPLHQSANALNTKKHLSYNVAHKLLKTLSRTRDPRGFAVKFYTEEGNWDIVGNNTPIFFIRYTYIWIFLFLFLCEYKLRFLTWALNDCKTN